MNEMTINFNGKDYLAIYNEQSGYYEINLQAPKTGGIYNANINFTDFYGEDYQDTEAIQIWAKEKLKLETNKVFMWIFDYKDFSVKDIVEISDYEINIDEETNANSTIKVLKKTTAKANDIIAFKKNNEVIYWSTIKEIQNEDGKRLYEFICRYITNMFDENVELKKNRNVDRQNVTNSIYMIKTVLDESKYIDILARSTENDANVGIWDNYNGENQKFKIIKKEDGYYTIQACHSNKYLTATGDGNVIQYTENNNDNQKWAINKTSDGYYTITSKVNGRAFDVANGSTENGTNVGLYTLHEGNNQKFMLEELEDEIIRKVGIEDFIAKVITENYIQNEDTFLNKNYLEIVIKTHTKLEKSVDNVENNIYNLHTFMTNCTQNNNIVYDFDIVDKKLRITIENKAYNKELIDTQAQAISNYTEVFQTDVVSKVIVLTGTGTYTLFLLNDRTTTEDMTNENRASGRTEVVYTEKYEDARQKALDTIKSNTYNHNITFNMFNKFIKIGTPIAIKTKESLIYDTYISAIKITNSKFVEYKCGNIRIGFIEKLKKEMNK